MLEAQPAQPPLIDRLLTRLRDEINTVQVDRRALRSVADALSGAVALEPGGPSAFFGRQGVVPVYPELGALDILDYAERTIWTDQAPGDIQVRERLIAEAGKLDGIADDSYDAVLASHVLEHLANPLVALAEWRRVVRPDGFVLLIVPHRDGTFDHHRPVTPLEHMRKDAKLKTDEDDLTHLDEILKLHDLQRDPGAPNREVFEQRCRENPVSRAMHHHVFDSLAVVELCRAAELEVLELRAKLPFNIVCLCRAGHRGGGELSDAALSKVLRRSPFATDRGDTRAMGAQLMRA